MKRWLLAAVAVTVGCSDDAAQKQARTYEAKSLYEAEVETLKRLENEKAEALEKLQVRYRELTASLRTLDESRLLSEQMQKEFGKDTSAEIADLDKRIKEDSDEQIKTLQKMNSADEDYSKRIAEQKEKVDHALGKLRELDKDGAAPTG